MSFGPADQFFTLAAVALDLAVCVALSLTAAQAMTKGLRHYVRWLAPLAVASTLWLLVPLIDLASARLHRAPSPTIHGGIACLAGTVTLYAGVRLYLAVKAHPRSSGGPTGKRAYRAEGPPPRHPDAPPRHPDAP